MRYMKSKPGRPPSLSRVTSIRVREDLWTRARIFAVKTNDTLQGVINRALEDLLKREEGRK
jgi:predicted transcriptional regulator